MKLNNVLSSAFPEIADSVKECVNLGQWLLFKSASIGGQNQKDVYFLKVDSQLFELDVSGRILKAIPRDEVSIHIDELYYFSDVPQPSSMSNTTFGATFIN